MHRKWVVVDNHIAIDTGKEYLHPDAEEVYAFVSEESEEESFNPVQALTNLHFSKIGSPIKCEVFTNDANKIELALYAIRKNERWPVDMVQGHIIDHGVTDSEWYYINGDIESLQEILLNSNIERCGEITIGQYVNLMKQEYFAENKEIINNVDPRSLSQMIIDPKEIPIGLKADLYDYQKVGYSWMKNMLSASQGCILGDEMGLGKTLQIITVFLDLKKQHKMPVLVVAPVSLLENWKRECKKFAPELNVFVHHGPKRTGRAKELLSHDVIVISYNTAVSDLSLLKMINWNCVVLDEAQNIKNPESERAKSVKLITRKSSVAVTGTPFENHITDIWSLVDFAVPGLLGTLKTFKENISDDTLGAEKIEPILSPIMIRRLVKDVANDLPEKVIISQPIVMSDFEIQDYCQIQKEAKEAADSGSTISLGLLQKLRMFCTHCLLSTDYEDDPFSSSIKYQRLCEILEEIISREEKAIVFTSYKKMFEIFRKDLPRRFDIKLDTINGETPVGERQQIVDWFNNYNGPAILILNPRAAGTGLNITGANHVIHYNLEWNPSLEDQASARAYRRGQKSTVFIYRLYYTDTVEEVVNERIERKREIATTAIVGTDGSNNEKNDILKALELAPQIQRKE